MPDGSATAHRYEPKLISILREGYTAAHFRKDVFAALTVAIVAFPLSLAIAIASGVSPERGLYASIIGGALVSILGGSRFQIGGPAGAFIVLVAATQVKYGIEGLLLTVFLSGVLLTVLGFLRVGALIRHMPHAVIVGFTCGIAVTILASQLKDFAGLRLAEPEPGPFLPKMLALSEAIGTAAPAAVGLSVASAALIFILRRWAPKWPGMLMAVVLMTVVAVLLHLPVETVGMRFGELPQMLPAPRMPAFDAGLLLELLPTVMSFTLLGGIESLLSAKVADGMSGRKHRSNMELVAQGIANIGSALFGGISVTGTIARTATNIRAGAHSPVSGILHAAFLLIFLVAAAPLAAFVPLPVLAGLLVVVCWNMAEGREFARLLRYRREAAVLLATFIATLAVDLAVGITVGCAIAAIMALFGYRPVAEDK